MVVAFSLTATFNVSGDEKPLESTCSPDGEHFVMVQSDGRLKFKGNSDAVTVHTFYLCKPKVIRFSNDGRFLASAGEQNGCSMRVKVWDLKNGKKLCDYEMESSSVPLLLFSDDGMLIASTSDGYKVQVWKVSSGTLKSTFEADRAVKRLLFGKNNLHLSVLGATSEEQRFFLVAD